MALEHSYQRPGLICGPSLLALQTKRMRAARPSNPKSKKFEVISVSSSFSSSFCFSSSLLDCRRMNVEACRKPRDTPRIQFNMKECQRSVSASSTFPPLPPQFLPSRPLHLTHLAVPASMRLQPEVHRARVRKLNSATARHCSVRTSGPRQGGLVLPRSGHRNRLDSSRHARMASSLDIKALDAQVAGLVCHPAWHDSGP